MRNQAAFESIFTYLGARINYRIIGKGQPVLLVHGAFTNISFTGFDKLLAKTHQVYLIDLPGFGASECINGQVHNTDLFADVLSAFIKKHCLESVPIIALSLGAIIAIKTAAKGYTKGPLILVGMPTQIIGIIPVITGKIPLSLRRALINSQFGKNALLLPAIKQNLGSGGESDKEILEMIAPTDVCAIADTDYKKEVEYDLPRALAHVKNKMFFLYGETDPTQPKSKNIVKHYEVIPHTSHNPFWEDPSTTLKCIQKYL